MAGYGARFGDGRGGLGLELDERAAPPSAWLERFFTDFANPPSMLYTVGGGSISESGGALTIAVASGANGDWDPDLAPIAWVPAHDRHCAFDTFFRYESRLYSYATSGGTTSRAGVAIYKDFNNGHEFGYSAADGKIYVTRWMSGSASNVAQTAGAVTAPSTAPHTYRIYWNPTSRPLYIGEIDAIITANSMQFWYRVGDAGTWTLLHTRDWEWLPGDVHFACCAHNYVATKHGVTARFSYSSVYQWNAAMQPYEPAAKAVSLLNASADPKDRLGLEDTVAISRQGGQPSIDLAGLTGSPDQGYVVSGDRAGVEDAYSYLLSLDPKFCTATQDSDAHYHFSYNKPYLAIYHDGTNDAWNAPTSNGFTGYARDGYKYTNGVQDAGPVAAPWRSEASGVNRSSRADFPLRVLIVVTRLELVIFDLDTFTGAAASLRVWMRFLLGNDVSNFYALGRGAESIQSVMFSGGLLVVGTKDTGWEVGRLHLIDFKGLTPATTYNMVGNDNEWVGQGTKTVVDRNTNSIWAVSGSYRIVPSEVRDITVLSEGINTHYVALSGEDPGPQILKLTGGVVQWLYKAAGDNPDGTGLGNYRRVLFDDVGWLWFSIGSVLYRNCRDWREGFLLSTKADPRQGIVDLGTTITSLVYAKDSIYAGTVNGVYRIHKGSLQAYLAYTVVGGGGRGRLNTVGAGELLAGTQPSVWSLMAYTLLEGSTVIPYLSVGTMYDGSKVGGRTLIRLWDDVVVSSAISPTIIEPGTYISPALLA